MIVGIQGTTNFEDYKVFLRAMGVSMSMIKESDKDFILYSAGPGNINSMASEFFNLSEKGMKGRGMKIKLYKVAPTWISENIKDFDYIAYFSTPTDINSRLIKEAEENNIEVGIFRH